MFKLAVAFTLLAVIPTGAGEDDCGVLGKQAMCVQQ